MNMQKSNGSIGMSKTGLFGIRKWYGIGMNVMGLRLDGMAVRLT